MGSAWVTALFGLLGTVVGAIATLCGLFITARRTRREHLADRLDSAVVELLASVDVLFGEYESLWFEMANTGRDSAESRAVYARCVDAWAVYQRARALVRVTAPPEVDEKGGDLRTAVYDLVNTLYKVYDGRRKTSPASLDDWRNKISAADLALRETMKRPTRS